MTEAAKMRPAGLESQDQSVQRRAKRREWVTAAYKGYRRRGRWSSTVKLLAWLAASVGGGWAAASFLGLSGVGGAIIGFLAGEGWAAIRQQRRALRSVTAASTLGFTIDVSISPEAHELAAVWADMWRSRANPDAAASEPPEALVQSRRFHFASIQAVGGRALIWDDSAKSAAPWLKVHGLYWGTLDDREGWRTQPDFCLTLSEGWLELWLTSILDPAARERAREQFGVGANMGDGFMWPMGAKPPVLIGQFPLADVLNNIVIGEAEGEDGSLSDWDARGKAQRALLLAAGFAEDARDRELRLPFDSHKSQYMTVYVRAWNG